jgi:hypothetical protein
MATARERINEIKKRLDPVQEPDDLWSIIELLLQGADVHVIRTIEDWLADNYPTKEETLDIINTPKFWKERCWNCQHRNRAKLTILWDDTDLCSQANAGSPPIVKNGMCQTRKTDFSAKKLEG